MKLYDCILFNDELELLELRLKETEDVVGKWVIVECGTNFQQKPKPLFFKDNKSHFGPYLNRIHHVVIDKHPVGPHPVIEHYQRRCLQKAWLDAGAVVGDLIMISDADEIANPETLKKLLVAPPPTMVVLKQYLYYYTVDCLQNQTWNGPIVFRLGPGEYDAQRIRDRKNRLPAVKPGGWHFSWLGPVDRIQYKLRCLDVGRESRGDFHRPSADDVEFISECIKSGKDIFGRTDEYAKKRFVDIVPGSLHPKHIESWLQKYPQFAQRP